MRTSSTDLKGGAVAAGKKRIASTSRPAPSNTTTATGQTQDDRADSLISEIHQSRGTARTVKRFHFHRVRKFPTGHSRRSLAAADRIAPGDPAPLVPKSYHRYSSLLIRTSGLLG